MSDNEVDVKIIAQTRDFISGINEAAEKMLQFTKIFVGFKALSEVR